MSGQGARSWSLPVGSFSLLVAVFPPSRLGVLSDCLSLQHLHCTPRGGLMQAGQDQCLHLLMPGFHGKEEAGCGGHSALPCLESHPGPRGRLWPWPKGRTSGFTAPWWWSAPGLWGASVGGSEQCGLQPLRLDQGRPSWWADWGAEGAASDWGNSVPCSLEPWPQWVQQS